MKFLLDQDVYAITCRLLINLGHDVVTAFELGLSQASDLELLKIASEKDRILVTRDRHFGGLVFVQKLGSGVIYLRVLPSNTEKVHKQLEKVLKNHSEEQLKKAFAIVEPRRYRFRIISD